MAHFCQSLQQYNRHRDTTIAHLFAQGVQRIELLNPLQDVIVQDHECIALDNIQLDIGGRDW